MTQRFHIFSWYWFLIQNDVENHLYTNRAQMNIWRFTLFWYMKTIYRYTGSSRTFGLLTFFFTGVPVLFKVNVPPFKSSPVFYNTHTIKYTNLHFIVHWYSCGQKVILSSWRAHLICWGRRIAPELLHTQAMSRWYRCKPRVNMWRYVWRAEFILIYHEHSHVLE